MFRRNIRSYELNGNRIDVVLGRLLRPRLFVNGRLVDQVPVTVMPSREHPILVGSVPDREQGETTVEVYWDPARSADHALRVMISGAAEPLSLAKAA